MQKTQISLLLFAGLIRPTVADISLFNVTESPERTPLVNTTIEAQSPTDINGPGPATR